MLKIDRNKFQYVELVKDSLSNRGNYITGEKLGEVFKSKAYKGFSEYWMSMFRYKTNQPTDKDHQLGNFYIECDEEDFFLNKETILSSVRYMHEKYEIPYIDFNFFVTNRSIWCEVPFKIFGCKGSSNLHLIYKEMAKEINNHVKRQVFIMDYYNNKRIYSKGLDLSIYKWNGLIHCVGSYLPKTKKRVSKFKYHLLEEALAMDDLRETNRDLCAVDIHVETVDKAHKWYVEKRREVLFSRKEKTTVSSHKAFLESVANLFRSTEVEVGYRNNAVASYSLVLKGLDYDKEDAYNTIVDWLIDTGHETYAQSREVLKTVNSIYKGKYNFSLDRAKELLPIIDFSCIKPANKNTFIIPRLFIEKMNDNRVNHNARKILMEIIYHNQVLNKNYIFNLKGEKYKKLIISYFEKLQEIGLIVYEKIQDKIHCKLVEHSREVYSNYVIIPVSFIKSKTFKKMGMEIKLLLEILRASIRNENGFYFLNMKFETIMKNLRCTKDSLKKYFNKLIRLRMFFNNILSFNQKSIVDYILKSIKKNKGVSISKKFINNLSELSKEGISHILSLYNTLVNSINNKVIYSHCLE